MSEQLVTVKDYAQMKGVTEETVRRWIRKGLVPVERTGPRGWYRIIIQEAA